MTFKDHFSIQSAAYAAARPTYPDALFDALLRVVPAQARVWEPGCGSGQATRGLAARFTHVHATDASTSQLAHHWAHDTAHAGCVTLAVEPAEHTILPDESVGLVAVAQALHWFNRPRFFAECDRVLVPGGVLAAWGYADFETPAGMEASVHAFRAAIDAHWPRERADVDAHLAQYDWPFEALGTQDFKLDVEWTLPHFLDYLHSLSATVRCRESSGVDTVAVHADALSAEWGTADALRTIRWPLFLHLRRKPPEAR